MFVALFSYNQGNFVLTVAEGVKENGLGGQTQHLPFFSGRFNQLDSLFWRSNPQRHSFPSQKQKTRFRPVILSSQDSFIPVLHVLITISFPSLPTIVSLYPEMPLEHPRMTSSGCSSLQEGQSQHERISRHVTYGRANHFYSSHKRMVN